MIVLINPPNPPRSVSNKDTMGGLGQLHPAGAKHGFPPLDILYSAAVLKIQNIPFHVIECLGLKWDVTELVLHLEQKKPKFVAIRTSVPTFEWDMKVARIIKNVTDSKIIIFGPFVTMHAKPTLQFPFVDAIVLGEPEITLAEIAGQLDFEGCKGVWYKKGGTILHNQPREPISRLDELPFPAWDLTPYRSYDGVELMRNIKPFMTMLTSRGCPHGCSYCPYPVVQGRKLRVRSPENVVDELNWLSNSLELGAVLFRDPEFAFYRERVVAICEGILKKKIRLAWRCETRLEDLDEELITLMARAGCIGINMGIESADERVLRNLKRKPVPFQRAEKIIKSCNKNNIAPFCFFILGLPGETKKSALKTIRYALKLDPAFLQFTVATPYPGTELKAWAEKNKFIENNDFFAMTGYNTAMRNEAMTSNEIQMLQLLANEAREMKGKRIAARLKRNAFQIGSEVRRWMKFQRAKILSGL